MTKNNSQSSGKKFIIVGIGNTILDFALMNIFSLFLPAPIPNFISTGISMFSSFYFNKKWTFESKNSSRKDLIHQTIMFFVFTIIGIWVIQTPLMWLISSNFPDSIREFSASIFGDNLTKLLIENFAKILASVVSLTWNFLTYKRFVFADKNEK